MKLKTTITAVIWLAICSRYSIRINDLMELILFMLQNYLFVFQYFFIKY